MIDKAIWYPCYDSCLLYSGICNSVAYKNLLIMNLRTLLKDFLPIRECIMHYLSAVENSYLFLVLELRHCLSTWEKETFFHPIRDTLHYRLVPPDYKECTIVFLGPDIEELMEKICQPKTIEEIPHYSELRILCMCFRVHNYRHPELVFVGSYTRLYNIGTVFTDYKLVSTVLKSDMTLVNISLNNAESLLAMGEEGIQNTFDSDIKPGCVFVMSKEHVMQDSVVYNDKLAKGVDSKWLSFILIKIPLMNGCCITLSLTINKF